MPAQPFFQVPTVEDNEDGWGPTTVPQQLEGIPYAPFSKGEKVSKISDFTGSGFNRFGGRGRDQGQGVAVFNFFHNEEEDSFHLVDNKPAAKNKGQRRFNPQRFAHRNTQFSRGQPEQPHQARQKQQKQRQFQNFHRDNQRQVTYSSSVDIRPEWPVVESIPFTSLAKLNFTVGKPEDIAFCGALEYYDKVYDRVTPKVDRPLKRTNKVFKSVTTSDDPVIRKLASEDKAQVFMTDVLLTSLMCAPRSVYSWDIVVTRAGDKLFFDKRDGSNLDYLTVAETAPESVLEEKDNINGVQQLSQEATGVNQAFSQQVLVGNGEKYECGSKNPFAEGNENLASTAYRYRKYKVSADTELVVRCEIDGVLKHKGQDELLSVKALNEFDPKLTGVDWRHKLETQRGAVLATELKNNANKLAKWTAAALVSGVEIIKLGYVSRVHQRDTRHHVILGTQVCKPKDFAMQINLHMENCWGIVRAVIDLCLKLDEGKYLIVKEPNKPVMRLYSVPENAFEQNYTDDAMPENEEAPADEAPGKAEDKDDDKDKDEEED